ncbi:MAG: protein methyltransferase, partial [Sulfolobaceae archaeon]
MPLNEGDPVVIWIDNKRVYIVRLEKGKKLHTDKGYVLHDDMIGLEYGSSIKLS